MALGSPGYMAPELWNDASKLDTATDAYAFGVVVAELFTGRHPLAGVRPVHTLAEWRLGHLERHPILLRNLGAEPFLVEQEALHTADERARLEKALEVVERLVERLLSKEREARPEMGETLAELRVAAVALGEDPYLPPEIYPRTRANETTFWLGQADARAHFKLQTDALARIERALTLAPQDPQVLSTYGHILEGLGQLEEAVTVYQRALSPTDAPVDRSRIITLLGTALRHLGRYGEAETIYVAQLDSTPDDSSGWFNRGLNEAQWAEAEANAGRLGEAREHMEQGLACVERALALEPDRSPYQAASEELRHLRDALESQ
jgi:tetratricopeptide (TPR) repeat protein